jgi:hypothetical protein
VRIEKLVRCSIATLIILLLLPACRGNADVSAEAPTEDIAADAPSQSFSGPFAQELRDNAKVEIEGAGSVKLIQPDLVKIFDEAISSGDEDVIDYMRKNMAKYTVESMIQAEVAEKNGKWELKGNKEVNAELQKSVDQFVSNYLQQMGEGAR